MGSDNSGEIYSLRDQINNRRRHYEEMLKSIKEYQDKREIVERERFKEMMQSLNSRIEVMREDAREREKKYEEEIQFLQQRIKEIF